MLGEAETHVEELAERHASGAAGVCTCVPEEVPGLPEPVVLERRRGWDVSRVRANRLMDPW